MDEKENYKVVMVNGSIVTNNIQHDQLGSATSSGEFGSVLRAIFTPESQTEFSGSGDGLRGRWQHVFAFHTGQPIYSIRHGESKRTIIKALTTRCLFDRDTKMVTRIRLECKGIPGGFPDPAP